MISDTDTLPTDPDALRALLLAERARHAEAIARTEQERDAAIGESTRLRAIIQALQRHRFGRRSEQFDPDQLALGLEDTEQTLSAAEAKEDAARPTSTRSARRRTNRGALPKSLPRIETVIDIESRSCPCCSGELHAIGEDVAERLDVIPAQFRVLVVRRPKYVCRSCLGTVVQAPAPPRLIEGGLPTEALVAHVITIRLFPAQPGRPHVLKESSVPSGSVSRPTTRKVFGFNQGVSTPLTLCQLCAKKRHSPDMHQRPTISILLSSCLVPF